MVNSAVAAWIAERQEVPMHRNILALLAAAALISLPQIAFADGDGAVTGLVGGAVAGAVVGGPVGAVVGGAAGGVIGGAATGPQGAPCNSTTTQTTDNSGGSSTTQTTNCPN
jgi:hypothetical protein